VRRTVIPELLDSDAGTPGEIQASLADLRLINRWFGGTSTTAALVQRVIREVSDRKLSLLDVGAGSGDIPIAVARQLQQRGIELEVTLLDRAVTHLPAAAGNASGLRMAIGDAFALPFRDCSFDLVACALFIHHLDPDEAVRFLNEALRVARVAVLINDLRRSRVHLVAVYAGWLLYRSRLTRHDGPASVRRAYTRVELAHVLRRTGAAKVKIFNHYLFRMGAIAWKGPPGVDCAVARELHPSAG